MIWNIKVLGFISESSNGHFFYCQCFIIDSLTLDGSFTFTFSILVLKNVQKSTVWTHFKHLKGNLANQQTSFEMLLYLAFSSLSSQIMAGLPLSPLNSHSSESMGSSLYHFIFLCFSSFLCWKKVKDKNEKTEGETEWVMVIITEKNIWNVK